MLCAGQSEDCASCVDPEYNETVRMLAERGYDAEHYDYLFSWQEAAPADLNFIMTGYHLRDKGTGEFVDLYADDAGRFLTGFELALLDVRPKNWNPPPMLQPPEQGHEEISEMAAEPPVPIAPKVLEKSASPEVDLPALNTEELIAEDEGLVPYSLAKGPRRIGVVRRLHAPVMATGSTPGAGKWTQLSDGSWLWTMTFRSPNARAMRVHFTNVNLPEQARLLVYDANDPTEAYAVDFATEGKDFWSLSCFSDAVAVEVYLPPGAPAQNLQFEVKEVVHTYTDMGSAYLGKSLVDPGSCNLDVSCYPDWYDMSLAVAGYNTVTNTGQIICTGTLVADNDAADEKPYFLTANHCNTANSPGAVEVFWFYQTSTCNGTVPAIESVPRTSGTYFIAKQNKDQGTDFTLLKLKSAPPAAATYAGWSSSVVPVGTEVVDIHHPQGSYKRLSEGHLIHRSVPTYSAQRYHEVLWDEGTTEPASSGSPLFLEDTQLIIGQLYGGYASCWETEEPDYFGRFDKTLPLIRQWLMPTDPFDLDGSGTVDAADLEQVVKSALQMPVQTYADVDYSGTVDALDIQHVILAVKARASS